MSSSIPKLESRTYSSVVIAPTRMTTTARTAAQRRRSAAPAPPSARKSHNDTDAQRSASAVFDFIVGPENHFISGTRSQMPKSTAATPPTATHASVGMTTTERAIASGGGRSEEDMDPLLHIALPLGLKSDAGPGTGLPSVIFSAGRGQPVLARRDGVSANGRARKERLRRLRIGTPRNRSEERRVG